MTVIPFPSQSGQWLVIGSIVAGAKTAHEAADLLARAERFQEAAAPFVTAEDVRAGCTGWRVRAMRSISR